MKIDLTDKEGIALYRHLKRNPSGKLVEMIQSGMSDTGLLDYLEENNIDLNAVPAEIRPILQKIEKELPAKELQKLKEELLTEKYLVEPWIQHEVSGTLIETIRQAVEEQKTIDTVYYSLSSEEKTRRKIDPYGIRSKYLVGYCHKRKEIRSFRIDRFLEAKPTQKKFRRPPDFNIKEYAP